MAIKMAIKKALFKRTKPKYAMQTLTVIPAFSADYMNKHIKN
jgi:hypothetical protein